MFNTVMPFSATEETSSCETADDIPVSLTDLFGSTFMFLLIIVHFRLDGVNLLKTTTLFISYGFIVKKSNQITLSTWERQYFTIKTKMFPIPVSERNNNL